MITRAPPRCPDHAVTGGGLWLGEPIHHGTVLLAPAGDSPILSRRRLRDLQVNHASVYALLNRCERGRHHARRLHSVRCARCAPSVDFGEHIRTHY